MAGGSTREKLHVGVVSGSVADDAISKVMKRIDAAGG